MGAVVLGKLKQEGVIWGALGATTLTLVLVAQACGGGSGGPGPARSASREDLVMQPRDFRNVNTMTRVRGFFVDNRLGHLREALAVASSPRGGVYPVGTIIQLVPQEAMVKRRRGFDPATRDWEFFFLRTAADGTEIQKRGTTGVVNRFGGTCASCHRAAEPRFDMVCEHSHGCDPLPIGDDIIAAIQTADPRPRQ